MLRGHTDLVLDVAFSPDGTELASASYDKTMRIWELATKRHRVLRGHAGAVTRVVWRGMDHLVTASFDGTLRVWQVPATEPPSQDEVSRASSSDDRHDRRAEPRDDHRRLIQAVR